MATYIEYELEDGGTVLIEVEGDDIGPSDADYEPEAGQIINVSADPERDGGSIKGNIIKKAGITLKEALVNVKSSAKLIQDQLRELQADEVEVVFGLKVSGEAGVFAITKAKAEASYEVTLKWVNKK